MMLVDYHVNAPARRYRASKDEYSTHDYQGMMVAIHYHSYATLGNHHNSYPTPVKNVRQVIIGRNITCTDGSQFESSSSSWLSL